MDVSFLFMLGFPMSKSRSLYVRVSYVKITFSGFISVSDNSTLSASVNASFWFLSVLLSNRKRKALPDIDKESRLSQTKWLVALISIARFLDRHANWAALPISRPSVNSTELLLDGISVISCQFVFPANWNVLWH